MKTSSDNSSVAAASSLVAAGQFLGSTLSADEAAAQIQLMNQIRRAWWDCSDYQS